MKRAQVQQQQGFTLIEVAIVAVILSIIVLAMMVFTRVTDEAHQTTVDNSNMTFNTRRALERMTGEIRRSDDGHVTVDKSDPLYDSIELQVPLRVTDGTVIWGASGRNGWKIRYLVENDTLIRRVVSAGGVTMEMDQVMANHVDDDAGTGKGFSVTKNGGLLTLSVRVVAERSGRKWSREVTTAVSVRN